MTLRVKAAPSGSRAESGTAGSGAAEDGDSWASRIAKLIPAEALGFYGAAAAFLQTGGGDGTDGGTGGGTGDTTQLWFVAALTVVLIVMVRWVATKGADGKPQVPAIAIAVASFVVWLAAIGQPLSPIDLGGYAKLATVFAMFWGIAVPLIYRGDQSG